MRALGSTLTSLGDALLSLPDWAVAVALLAIAAIVALLIHRAIFALFDRAAGERHPFLHRIVSRTKGPLALALVVFALAIVSQSAPFEPTASATLGRLLLIVMIVLAGWIAHVAVETGSDLYLRRFSLDPDDNLWARKYVTQVRILKRALHTLIVMVTLGAVLMMFEPVRQYGGAVKSGNS
jgi:hypothetical protein